MAIEQSIWTLDGKKLSTASLDTEKELEDILCGNIAMLNRDWLIIGRQVAVEGGYIDILCVDRGGSLIVVELKRELTPREVTAQAIDYASCVAKWHIEDIAQAYLKSSGNSGTINDAYKNKFGLPLDEDTINSTGVSAVIVAAKMDKSTERIITYLNETYGVPLNILFFSVFSHNDEKLLSRVWLIDETEPAPNKTASAEWNGEYYISYGVDQNRSWKDAVRYGFISAGGGPWYTKTLSILSPGDRIWVNIPHVGYVGVGEVQERATKAGESKFIVDGQEKRFYDLELEGAYYRAENDENAEYLVKVKWLKTVDVKKAVKEAGFFGNQNTACRPANDKWIFTIDRLKNAWGINR
ncbi:MAG TPA: endonuclease NucS domain-containing protein [Terriglobales bacterium]|nr:endonuclease NucS domain-containing protein [Terriglobales bacterium]